MQFHASSNSNCDRVLALATRYIKAFTSSWVRHMTMHVYGTFHATYCLRLFHLNHLLQWHKILVLASVLVPQSSSCYTSLVVCVLALPSISKNFASAASDTWLVASHLKESLDTVLARHWNSFTRSVFFGERKCCYVREHQGSSSLQRQIRVKNYCSTGHQQQPRKMYSTVLSLPESMYCCSHKRTAAAICQTREVIRCCLFVGWVKV